MAGKMLEVIKGCVEGAYAPARQQKAKNALRGRMCVAGDPNWASRKHT